MSTSREIRSQVDLFSKPIRDISIVSSDYQKISPRANPTDNINPVEFIITGSDARYIDLYNTFIYVRAHITQQDGTKLLTTDIVAPGNLFLHTIFQNCNVSLNSTVVSDSNNYYPYHAWMQNQLCYASTTKDGELSNAVYYKDSDPDKYVPAENAGFQKRMDLAKESKIFEAIGRLSQGLFQQTRYLPPGVTLEISLRRSLPAFALGSATTSKAGVSGCPFAYILDEVSLFVRKHTLHPDVVADHQRMLNKNENFVYPHRRAQIKTFAVPVGSLGTTSQLVFSGEMPELIAVGLVTSSSFQGAINKSPFNFAPNNLTSITVTLDDDLATYRSLNFDFTNGQYLLGYNAMFKAAQSQFDGNSLTRTDFPVGNVIAVFDLISKNSVGAFHAGRTGQVKIELKFSTAVLEPLNAIIYGQFQGVVEIDKHKNVTLTNYDG